MPGAAGYLAGPAQTPAGVWLAMTRGEMDGLSAFMQGQYKAQGDLGLLMRFKNLFGK